MSLASISQRDPVAAFAIQRTMKLEGGLVEADGDNGGITNRGVSLRFALQQIQADSNMTRMFDVDHDGHVDRRDIAGLDADQAAEIYLVCFWQPYWFRLMAPELVAWKCFDIGVNAGPNRAALLLQKGLCAVGEFVAIDALIGAKSLSAVQRQAARDDGAKLLSAIRGKQADFYRSLVAKEPKLQTFLRGWLSRAAA